MTEAAGGGQLVAMVWTATQVLDDEEEVVAHRGERTVRLTTTWLGGRLVPPRVVVVPFAGVRDVVLDTYQSTLMRRPRYRPSLRLAAGGTVPLFNAYDIEPPTALVAALRPVLGLPADAESETAVAAPAAGVGEQEGGRQLRTRPRRTTGGPR
jgi:hypothetical protein